MVQYLLMISVLVLSGCADETSNPFVSENNKGVVCTVVQGSSSATISCPDGSSAIVGDGANGLQGVVGLPGTVISAIQFCQGYTPTYPGTFPEVGFCIGGQLYGEYYAPPSSGLTLLTPGVYNSTQTGAPCTFTVSSGCQVTQ